MNYRQRIKSSKIGMEHSFHICRSSKSNVSITNKMVQFNFVFAAVALLAFISASSVSHFDCLQFPEDRTKLNHYC